MSLAIAYSRAQVGINAPLVTVEVHLTGGLPSLSIVGLPEAAVKESKDRVRGALLNSQFDFPAKRITINLAPADLPKEGGRFDLPIAVGILAASGQIPKDTLKQYEFVGELALSGDLRGLKGVLTVALQARNANRALFVASDNADEAALVENGCIYSAKHLLDVCAHLKGYQPMTPYEPTCVEAQPHYEQDLSEVRGQHHAKRALEIVATGGHSLLMIGPPGTGKTMLASRLPGILPRMSEVEALETAAIKSISEQTFSINDWRQRGFRRPHHTASGVALVGGGSNPRPGEISLAHNGVLFLDELPEFDRKVLEVLREPLESGQITISRAAKQAEFPARFQLVAAMNPCPCGYHGHSNGRCHCTPEQVQRYCNRISGPLLDRIDMHIEVPNVPHDIIQNKEMPKSESSVLVRERVEIARQRQLQRSNKCNAQLSNKEIDRYCELNAKDADLLEQAIDRFGLSLRAYHRILKVARTIADLAGSPKLQTSHLMEAINFRQLDRARQRSSV
ncbi:MAG: YifB family Mg chelatase-like AAA ATPase [Gammaproteobacteria bacterium]|nr:YifB family Mg chelatase-like AAA ATPase [Gammaproteobacteria bacterium]